MLKMKEIAEEHETSNIRDTKMFEERLNKFLEKIKTNGWEFIDYKYSTCVDTDIHYGSSSCLILYDDKE